MSKRHTEENLEAAIEGCLLTDHAYAKGQSGDYDVEKALEPLRVLAFIKATQEKLWSGLVAVHGAAAEEILLAGLVKELSTKGMLNVLRNGFKVYGKKFRVAIFAPNNNKNPDNWTLYNKNELSVTRQLYYGEKHRKSLDMVLFLNGLPIITFELKSELPGSQKVEEAKKQYKNDRDQNELLFQFKKRALVHFAVDESLVFMATRLSGSKTFFLPFNLGCNGGAGNRFGKRWRL